MQQLDCIGLSEPQPAVGSWVSGLLGPLGPCLTLQVLFSPLGFPSSLTKPMPHSAPLSLLYTPQSLCSWHQQPSCVFSDIFLPAEGLHEQRCEIGINRTFLKMLCKHWLAPGKGNTCLGVGTGGRIFIMYPFVPFEF